MKHGNNVAPYVPNLLHLSVLILRKGFFISNKHDLFKPFALNLYWVQGFLYQHFKQYEQLDEFETVCSICV